MSKTQRPGPPSTYVTYRVVMLAVLGIGLFVLGLVVFPGLVAVVDFLAHAIANVLDFKWDPF